MLLVKTQSNMDDLQPDEQIMSDETVKERTVVDQHMLPGYSAIVVSCEKK